MSRPLATIQPSDTQARSRRLAVRIDLTFDCASGTTLAAFWKLALGYEDEPPPAPFATRQE